MKLTAALIASLLFVQPPPKPSPTPAVKRINQTALKVIIIPPDNLHDVSIVPTNPAKKGEIAFWQIYPRKSIVTLERDNEHWRMKLGTGSYEVGYTQFIEGVQVDSWSEFTIGPTPVPPDPTPVPPDPTPVPPEPTPAPPIDDPGNHVLIVYETGDQSTYTQGQIGFMYSQDVRTYMSEKCPRGTNSSGWYMLDKDAVTTALPAFWGKAMAKPRTKLPWMIVSNGKTGWEGPIPESYDEAFAKVKEFIK